MEGILGKVAEEMPFAVLLVVVVVFFLRYIKEAEERSHEFIKEQRTENNAAMMRLAEELKEIAAQVTNLRECFAAHDEFTREHQRKVEGG